MKPRTHPPMVGMAHTGGWVRRLEAVGEIRLIEARRAFIAGFWGRGEHPTVFVGTGTSAPTFFMACLQVGTDAQGCGRDVDILMRRHGVLLLGINGMVDAPRIDHPVTDAHGNAADAQGVADGLGKLGWWEQRILDFCG